MDKKVVIVTGASTGIGREIANVFISKGHYVVMNSINESNLRKTYEELGAPTNAVLFAGDIGRKDVGKKLVQKAIDEFNRIDVLVNNAGVFSPKPFLDVHETDLDHFLTTNLKGTYFTSQAAIREMLKTGGGSIINIGTVLVDHAISAFPASAPVSSKGAIHALTRQLAAEFGKHNIRVNTISPGIIRTPLQGKIGVQDADTLGALHLLNRIGEPDDIAMLAYTVATSTFITGETINVDGGHIAGHHIN